MSLPFRALGLGGGGIKGILHVGALLELSKHQPLTFPDGIYGCSVGSIIATYLAFELPLDKMVPLMNTYLNMEKMVPKFEFKHVSTAFSAKGLYPMDTFETSMKQMFQDVGLDIQQTKLGDAKMPLYIVASNITKGVPTIFSKDVSVIDALKCSCCIPGIFRPIELYEQMYVDGNLFVPCIASLTPKDGLVFTLMKQRKRRLTSALIETMSPIAYMDELYIMTSSVFHNACLTPNTLCLSYPNLHSDSNLSDFNIQAILDHAGTSFNQFISKRLL
jgi:predicted acylesterase/phospholipase RssA